MFNGDCKRISHNIKTTSLILCMSPLCKNSVYLWRQSYTRPLKVCCGVCNQRHGRCFKFSKLLVGTAMDQTCLSSTTNTCLISLRAGESGKINTLNILSCFSKCSFAGCIAERGHCCHKVNLVCRNV